MGWVPQTILLAVSGSADRLILATSPTGTAVGPPARVV